MKKRSASAQKPRSRFQDLTTLIMTTSQNTLKPFDFLPFNLDTNTSTFTTKQFPRRGKAGQAITLTITYSLIGAKENGELDLGFCISATSEIKTDFPSGEFTLSISKGERNVYKLTDEDALDTAQTALNEYLTNSLKIEPARKARFTLGSDDESDENDKGKGASHPDSPLLLRKDFGSTSIYVDSVGKGIFVPEINNPETDPFSYLNS